MSALAAIHVANKQLGLDEDTARDLYQRVTGKRSLREMNDRELQLIVTEHRRQGFKPAEKGLQGPFAKKLQALWIAALEPRHRPRSHRCRHAVLRQAADRDRAHPLPARRRGRRQGDRRAQGVDDAGGRRRLEPERFHGILATSSGAKIALAQWQVLSVLLAVDPKGFRKFVFDKAKPLDQMTERDWPAVMNQLGDMVRKAKA
jgi:hypothetical protein